MLRNELRTYISKVSGKPFLYGVGDESYLDTLELLKSEGLKIVRISDFCRSNDRYPDLDSFIEFLRTADVNYQNNKVLVIGLGELLALRGQEYANQFLNRVKNENVGICKVVLLLRCVTQELLKIRDSDLRLLSQGRIFIEPNSQAGFSVTRVKKNMGYKANIGIKNLLHEIEQTNYNNYYVDTALTFEESYLQIYNIENAYSALQDLYHLNLSEQYGTSDQWKRLLDELNKNDGSLEKIYSTYGIDDDWQSNINSKLKGVSYKTWIFFIFLKLNIRNIKNDYLSLVVEQTNTSNDLKRNILNKLITIPTNHKEYSKFYNERKSLVSNFSKNDINLFIKENKIYPKESIYRYTDNTLAEREEIIKWVSKYGYIEELSIIYPALDVYLKEYVFDCDVLSDELTNYFQKYKIQKIKNSIDPKFLSLVDKYSDNAIYSKLETRDNVLRKIEDKNSTCLFWIDSLGVEYLSLISDLAEKNDLLIEIQICRADLPTLTSINRSFFDSWPGNKKADIKDLDLIKHGKTKRQYSGDDPSYLASEIDLIQEVIEKIASDLQTQQSQAVTIASDHGASRLAVLYNDEDKYVYESKGEHSGRCCKTVPGADISYALKENGYWVLADYKRFKGSRAAKIETHGGATLEEVVIPVITLKLKKQKEIKVLILNKDGIYPDRRNGITLSIYISYVNFTNKVDILYKKKRYRAEFQYENHYTVNIDSITKPGQYEIEIYDGDNKIFDSEIRVKSKVGSINESFDDFFKEI